MLMIQPIGNFNSPTFRGIPQQEDELKFDDIQRIFQKRDMRVAEEARRAHQERYATEYRPVKGKKTTSSARKRSSVSSRQGTRKRTHISENKKRKYSVSPEKKIITRTPDGDVLEYTSKIRQLEYRDESPRSRRKSDAHSHSMAPYAIGLALVLGIFGIGAAVSDTSDTNTEETSTSFAEIMTGVEEDFDVSIIDVSQEPIQITTSAAPTDEFGYTLEEIEEAVNTIKSDSDVSQTFYNLISTKNRMQAVEGDIIEIIKGILNEPYAENVDIELVLSQIFSESSGYHYDEDGSVNSSWANCNGWMQVGLGCEEDMNRRYFRNNPQSRDNPIGNLKLGIAYNNWLYNYFDGDRFNAVAAYNCGQNNAENGNYYGADEYAREILECREILKNHPEYTQMLLDGVLDDYQNEFFVSPS